MRIVYISCAYIKGYMRHSSVRMKVGRSRSLDRTLLSSIRRSSMRELLDGSIMYRAVGVWPSEPINTLPSPVVRPAPPTVHPGRRRAWRGSWRDRRRRTSRRSAVRKAAQSGRQPATQLLLSRLWTKQRSTVGGLPEPSSRVPVFLASSSTVKRRSCAWMMSPRMSPTGGS